jgi:phospholipid transport system substrate-binding protein
MNGVRLSRRKLVLIAAAAVVAGPGHSVAGGSGAAVKYLHKVASDLMAAQRDGGVPAYFRMIKRHADLPSISMYALGQYQNQLPKSKRSAYFEGVADFMSRYFADQSRSYRVVKADIGANTRQDGTYILVDTKLTLASGATYTVVWRLAARRSSFRIADVKVLGFSLIYLQRRIFLSYISKKGGNVMALVSALTR